MSSYISLNPPLAARDGRVLQCVIVARISTEHQDAKSLDDQAAKCEAYVRDHFEGEVDFIKISSRGSGEFLDREELYQLEKLIESRTIDVVICEDLSRICRRQRAYAICESCPDYEVRLIAITDRIDTAVDGWQDSAHIATWHHERSNRDTAERIRRTLNHRFDQGGVVQFTIYGYIKPPGAKSDQDLQKDPEAEPVIREIFRRLEQGASYAEVADWLNERGVPPGPYCRRPRWDHTSVSRFVHQPILKGRRERNRKVSKRENKTGRHKTVKGTPQQLRVRECPHLAFLDPAYYDHVVQLLDARNAGHRRTANGQPDSRLNVPRKRTAFPGQHARCGVCGRLMHWHALKRLRYLLCSGAADYHCWHALYVPGPECAAAIAEAIIQALADMPDFDVVLGELVRQRLADFEGHRAEAREKLDRQLRDVSQRLARLMTLLETAESSDTLLKRLKELEQEQSSIRYTLQKLDQEPSPAVALPQAEQLRQRAVEALRDLSVADPETGRLLRELLPDLHIVPYQVCDGSAVVPRAEFTLTLVPLLPDELRTQPEAAIFTRRMVVTIGAVSQPAALYAEAATLQAQGFKQREIEKCLGIAQSAVERALRIHRIMKARGLTDPFVRLTTLPAKGHKMKRHQHDRYRFEPLVGYPQGSAI